MEEFMIDIEPKKENNEPESSFANTCEETAAPLADNENRENISPQSGEDLFGQQMRDEIPENFAVSDEAKDITAQIESLTSGLRKSGKTVTYTFELEGIGCPKSAEEIEQKVRGIIGVESAEINFNTTQLTVEVDRTMTAGLVRKINAAAKQTDRTIVLKPIGEAAELLMRRQPLRKEEDRYSFAKKTRLDSVLALLGNKDNQKLIFIMLCTAVLLAAIAVIFSKITVLSIICSVLAVLIAGYLPAVRAVKSIMQKRFDYNELAVFSAIASCCIGKFTASAVMLVAYRLYEYAEKWATSRSRKPLEEAKKAMTDEANLMVSADCSTEKVPSSSVSVGQMIVVFPNERIPLDGVVAEGEGTINSSDVTGETNLIDVKPGSAV
ncbi:MAG: heavy metal translocating P-type ATPase, partial [Acutalibacteraceae bacterium]